jgi:hypothetical protein
MRQYSKGGATYPFRIKGGFSRDVDELFKMYRYGPGVPRDQALLDQVQKYASKTMISQIQGSTGLSVNAVLWLMYYEVHLTKQFDVCARDVNSACTWDQSVFTREFYGRIYRADDPDYDDDDYEGDDDDD